MATGVDAKLLKSTKFPSEFNQKVDMQKVNLQVMKKYSRQWSPRALLPEADRYRRWIAGKISDILGNEDDVGLAIGGAHRQEARRPNPHPNGVSIDATGTVADLKPQVMIPLR